MTSLTWMELAERYPCEKLQELLRELACMAMRKRGLQLEGMEGVGHLRYEHYQAIKYRCDSQDGARFLLCVYVPNGDFDVLASMPEISASLFWLESLDHELDFPVQRPMRDEDGNLLSQVEIQGVATALCSLVTWLPGEPLDDDDGEEQLSLPSVRQMGSLLAKLHEHSSRWSLPSEFRCPTRPSERLQELERRLNAMADRGEIPPADLVTAHEVVNKIRHDAETCGRDQTHWGLLHGDFHAGNCVVESDVLHPIDFEGCCMGFYGSDLAWCMLMQEFDPERIEAFLGAYASVRSVPPDHSSEMERLILQEVLWFIAERKGLGEKISFFAKEEFEKYLKGLPFLVDHRRTWL